MSNTTYTLTLNTDQAKLLSHACDIYSRLLMGQWDRLCEETLDWGSRDFDQCLQDRDKIEELLAQARAITWPYFRTHPGTSWGVGHFKDADMIWEIHQVLRNCIAWHEKPEGDWTVDFDKPMSFSGEELAKCEAKDD